MKYMISSKPVFIFTKYEKKRNFFSKFNLKMFLTTPFTCTFPFFSRESFLWIGKSIVGDIEWMFGYYKLSQIVRNKIKIIVMPNIFSGGIDN